MTRLARLLIGRHGDSAAFMQAGVGAPQPVLRGVHHCTLAHSYSNSHKPLVIIIGSMAKFGQRSSLAGYCHTFQVSLRPRANLQCCNISLSVRGARYTVDHSVLSATERLCSPGVVSPHSYICSQLAMKQDGRIFSYEIYVYQY